MGARLWTLLLQALGTLGRKQPRVVAQHTSAPRLKCDPILVAVPLRPALNNIRVELGGL